jgi:hypothetical protein
MQELKPVAEVLLWNEVGGGEYREFRASENLPHGTKLYDIPATHRIVPVELLRGIQVYLMSHRLSNQLRAIIDKEPT